MLPTGKAEKGDIVSKEPPLTTKDINVESNLNHFQTPTLFWTRFLSEMTN